MFVYLLVCLSVRLAAMAMCGIPSRMLALDGIIIAPPLPLAALRFCRFQCKMSPILATMAMMMMMMTADDGLDVLAIILRWFHSFRFIHS